MTDSASDATVDLDLRRLPAIIERCVDTISRSYSTEPFRARDRPYRYVAEEVGDPGTSSGQGWTTIAELSESLEAHPSYGVERPVAAALVLERCAMVFDAVARLVLESEDER